MRIFGLIGYPLSHSFSASYFAEKFAREKITGCRYLNFPLENIEKFPELLQATENLCGLNVTIPYKQKILAYLDEMEETASAIGAVNTIKISRKENGFYLTGFNTDVYGFMESLKPLLAPRHRQALILGTGGSSKAVKYGLEKLGISFLFVSSSVRNASQGIISYEEITEEVIKRHLLIVNCTPLGMWPNVDSCPPIPYSHLTSDHLLYDLVYNPSLTAFMKKGMEKGAVVKNGLEMLHLQAEKAWEIWNS